MPHQCTECGHVFPDGSKEMLSGCPDCGGNKFQFQPTSDARDAALDDTAAPDAGTRTDDARPDDGAPLDADTPPDTDASSDADTPSESTDSTETVTVDSADAADSTETDDATIAALRRELDDQFESIKILEPGQYELNLMELYNREERIIALQEDGQYVIDVPDAWLGDDS